MNPNAELSQRARQLVATRGFECEFDNGEPFRWREAYVGSYKMTVTDRGHLQIRTQIGADVYTQCEPQKEGRLGDPILAAECLELMRQQMVLDDLASI